MNSLQEVTKKIEAAGLEVEIREWNGPLLAVGIDKSGRQRFVLRSVDPSRLRVRDVDRTNQMVLMEVLRRDGTPEVLLFGQDERYFVTGVPTEARSVAHALKHLVPIEVQVERLMGVDVKRQGDWFFIPVTGKTLLKKLNARPAVPSPSVAIWRKSRGRQICELNPLGDHGATSCIVLKSNIFVRGYITHREHHSLYLNEWHRAVQNQAVRKVRVMGGRIRD
jgi:hypothetical protein